MGKPTPAQISAWEQSHGKKPVSKPTKPEIAAAAAGRTVVYAFAADMSGITDNLAWSSSWQAKGNSNTTTGKDSSLQYWQTSSVSGPPKTIEATLIVDGQHKDDAMTFTQSLVRPFAYSSTPNPPNTTNPSMWVFAQAAVQAYASSGGAPAGYSPVPVSINTGLQFPGSATMSGSALSLNNPSDSDPPVRSSWTWNAFESLSVSPGEDLTLTFQITSATQKQSSFKDYDGANFPSETQGEWSVSGLTLAWSQSSAS